MWASCFACFVNILLRSYLNATIGRYVLRVLNQWWQIGSLSTFIPFYLEKRKRKTHKWSDTTSEIYPNRAILFVGVWWICLSQRSPFTYSCIKLQTEEGQLGFCQHERTVTTDRRQGSIERSKKRGRGFLFNTYIPSQVNGSFHLLPVHTISWESYILRCPSRCFIKGRKKTNLILSFLVHSHSPSLSCYFSRNKHLTNGS